ncbi:997_t:CDS:2 [Gigaspora rosea]|nr:997_t:CDS:2 [Gigaspora rosea]
MSIKKKLSIEYLDTTLTGGEEAVRSAKSIILECGIHAIVFFKKKSGSNTAMKLQNGKKS